MRTRDFIALEERLLPFMDGFQIEGPLMFLPPLERLLRGVSFEGSSFDKTSFYVDAFVMPLCVPSDHLYFNFGRRIRHEQRGDRWSTDMPNLVTALGEALRAQALPLLNSTASLIDFVSIAGGFRGNPHAPMAIAYALARSGETDRAIGVIGELLRELDPSIAWQRDIGDKTKALREQLVKDPSEAQRKLETWEVETLRNLGLEKFRKQGS